MALVPPKAQAEKLLEGFLLFFVTVLSNYRSHFDAAGLGSGIAGFKKIAFVRTAHPSLTPFLSQFVETKLFEQFIALRVKKYSKATPKSNGAFDRRDREGATLLKRTTPAVGAPVSPVVDALSLEVRSSRFSKFHDSQLVSLLDLELSPPLKPRRPPAMGVVAPPVVAPRDRSASPASSTAPTLPLRAAQRGGLGRGIAPRLRPLPVPGTFDRRSRSEHFIVPPN